MRPITSRLVVTSAVLLASSGVQATNGYFTHGIGTHNKALAGAGIAAPSAAIDIANNPAAAVMVGKHTDLGLAVFSPRRSYKTTESQLNGNFGAFTLGPDDIDSENEWWPIPHFAMNWPLDEESAIGLTAYARGGMNTEYKGGSATFSLDGPGPLPPETFPGPFGSGTLGVDLMQLFIEVAYAGKIGALNWGVSPIIAVQRFEAKGVANFTPYTTTFAASNGATIPDSLSNNGHDWSWGYGIKGGLIWEINDVLNAGASYQSQIHMSEIEDYSDLFARGGQFDIPASLRLGVSWQAMGALRLHLDYEHIGYSDIDSISNPVQGILNCPTAGFGGTDVSACMGGRNGIGFGWKDMSLYKLGVEWSMSGLPQWTFRAGYSAGDQPIPKQEVMVNIMAPAVMEQHFTFGFSRESSNGHEFSMAFMYAPSNTLKGPNFFDPTQDIELEMEQFELEFAYSW